MTKHDIIVKLGNRERHWRAREAEQLGSDYAPDAVLDSPIFGVLKGRDLIAASYSELLKLFHSWTFSPGHLLVEGNRSAQPFRMDGRHSEPFFGRRPTGRPFRLEGVIFATYVGTQIVHERVIYDTAGMLDDLDGVARQ